MNHLFNTLFLNNRLFYILGGVIALFVIGFFTPFMMTVAKVILLVVSVLLLFDIILLYSVSNGVSVNRTLPEKLSNGDQNKISLQFFSRYKSLVHIDVIEELPFQFQKRDFIFNIKLTPNDERVIHYDLTPTERGIYLFGKINAYTSTPLQLATRKYILGEEKELICYPSFLRLQDFDIKTFNSDTLSYGTKKIRRIGHSLEFEQIKEYVNGDDIRTLNWKATAKRNQLMVNQYVEEKSQPVYSIIDKGRTMQLHFNNITLLDYAINATLAVSNAILRKQDKAGMLSFSKKLEDLVVAESRYSQMRLLSETLYNIKTDFSESDFSNLYAVVKRKITQRSLLILYTNFETMDSLKRQLPYLRALSKIHLVLVVFFKNTDLNNLIDNSNEDILSVYDSIIAKKFRFEKKQIVKELRKYGIQSVLTEPKNLTGDTINKYLELKSRGFF